MKNLILSFILILTYTVSYGQDCACPTENIASTKNPEIIFHFRNNNQLGICGSYEINDKDTVYSEFTLFECGKNKSIEEWDATESCIIKRIKDTIEIS